MVISVLRQAYDALKTCDARARGSDKNGMLIFEYTYDGYAVADALILLNQAIKKIEEEGPAERLWLGLDSNEIHEALCEVEYNDHIYWDDDPKKYCQAFYRYVEERLKEKNGG